jgi:putrescine N-hydroxylase
MNDHIIYDVLGVGLGPFNLSLAALLDKFTRVSKYFIEQKPKFNWHEGLLIEDTTLQVPYLADLVTMVEPTNPYSYLNYVKQHGKMFQHFFLEEFLISRAEYIDYCRWVSEQLDFCHFEQEVMAIDYKSVADRCVWQVTFLDHKTNTTCSVLASNIVLGIGTVPKLPACLPTDSADSKLPIFHSGAYLPNRGRLHDASHITVLGSGQSAAEIVLDLLNDEAHHQKSISWVTAGAGFFPMLYSKLGLEYFSPDYIDYFYRLPHAKKQAIIQNQDLLYKGISNTTITDIYKKLYARDLLGRPPVQLLSYSQLNDARISVGLELDFEHLQQARSFTLNTSALICCTGYQYVIPDFLANIREHIQWLAPGQYVVSRQYQVQLRQLPPEIKLYIQNGEMPTHGVGAPDLTLCAYRSAVIANQLLGDDYYQLPAKNVFCHFGIPEDKNEYGPDKTVGNQRYHDQSALA